MNLDLTVQALGILGFTSAGFFIRSQRPWCNIINMFRAIGFLIILYALTQFLGSAFAAFERSAVAVLGTVETAADVSTEQLEKLARSE